MLSRFDLECLALTRTDEVLRHLEAMRVTATQICAKKFQLIHQRVKRNRTLFGQGRVLSANKTVPPSVRVFVPSSVVVGALNAFGLFARAGRRSR